ncbi:MAG: hypothetical protein DHS20C14_01160 [Phycisphaeraceae bacterium]|nr:MAG: hypothetical protein DHS20C14_01160 [Phycisphaeraceae bacterium]
MAAIDTLNAGQTITCTVAQVPANEGGCDTICRLMRRDPDIKRGLARAQRLRRQRMHVYIRGNRRWHSRETAARIARCVEGASWSMPYTHDIAPDLASVEKYLKIESA